MKIVHINFTDITGGAAKAANRLHQLLRNSGVNSYMVVFDKKCSDNSVFLIDSFLIRLIWRLNFVMERILLRLYFKRKEEYFSLNLFSNPLLVKKINSLGADIIHLHWFNNSMLGIKDIARLKAPVVITLHDNWLLTGGCHLMNECSNFTLGCGNCPILGSSKKKDLSSLMFKLKKKYLNNSNVQLISLSTWIESKINKSAITSGFDNVRIPNIISPENFQIKNKTLLRNKYNIPENRKVLIFGAFSALTDKNKGFNLLAKSLEMLTDKSNILLIVFGEKIEDLDKKLQVECVNFGLIKSELIMSELLGLSDLTILPSKQETLPQIAIESLLSGTPILGYSNTGICDIVVENKNGILFHDYTPQALAIAIEQGLNLAGKLNQDGLRDFAFMKYNPIMVMNQLIQTYKTRVI